TRRLVNLHLQPARDAEALYQLKDGTKVELIKRSTSPKAGMKALKAAQQAAEEKDSAEEEKKSAADEEPPAENAKPAAKGRKNPPPASATQLSGAQLEDWWLVRDQQKHVGWLLGRMLDVDVPLEIAQYAEGQRIVASFVLSEV